MLKTRLILGSLMAAAAGGVLFVDSVFSPYYPILLLLALTVGVLATRELVALIPAENRPREWLCLFGVIVLLGLTFIQIAFFIQGRGLAGEVYAAFLIIAFLVELFLYRELGNSITRVAHGFLVVGYLGFLPNFFLKIRLMNHEYAGWMFALAIFVPKCCDIGAYFTGRLIGKHPMTPRLSPKKTWEGLAGGLTLAVIVAVVAGQFLPVFHNGIIEAIAFGLALGFAGILGDLAASMIKRDALAKDSSRAVPGFGGVLDVIDSILFAGPVAYFWFRS